LSDFAPQFDSGKGRKNHKGNIMSEGTKKIATALAIAMAAIAIVERVPAIRKIVKGA